MVEIIDNKESFKKEYEAYPSVTPEGFEPRHTSRIEPIAYEIKEGSKVLDVGANDGEFMKLLKEKRGCEVYGIDLSDVAIAKAKEKGIEILKADGEAIPFPDETFDVVCLMEVLSHLHDPAKVLSEVRRVLKKDGVLLGSCPHKNLESFIWEEKRLHRRYMDERDLRDLLEPVFPYSYVRTLNGAQFATAMANSFIGNKPAEMLFKAGGDETRNWEVDLISDEKLRVWFGYTLLSGTAYYRMTGYADKMDKLGIAQSAYERGTSAQMDEMSVRWQKNIRNKVILNHLDQILRVAHISVWQLTASRDVLSFLRCAKDLMDGQWYQATGTKKKIVTEIDDYIFDLPSYNVASGAYSPNSESEWVAQKQIELSDAVVCSTQFLLDQLRQLFPEKPLFLVPNSIDFDIWDNLKPTDDFPAKDPGQIRIGYTGCSNHREDMEMLKEPLSAILHEFPNVQFVFTPQPYPDGIFMGWQGVPNMGLVQKWVPIDQYPNFVAGWGMDIGIAPLRDNNFNRAKSNLRWLEYSALGIPTVASRVYPFKNSINHGEDGLIANSSREWYDQLKSLIVDAGRRAEIGRKAYECVKRDYNMESIAKRYAAILEELRSCRDPISKVKSGDSLEIPTELAGFKQS